MRNRIVNSKLAEKIIREIIEFQYLLKYEHGKLK